MSDNDEVLEILRGMRDLQREQLDLIREKYAQQDIQRKEWLETDKKRHDDYLARSAKNSEECLARCAKESEEYEQSVRSYGRATAAYTAMCTAIVFVLAAGAMYLIWPR